MKQKEKCANANVEPGIAQSFQSEVTKKLICTNMVFQLITVALSVAMGYGSVTAEKLPLIIILGIAICVFLHAASIIATQNVYIQSMGNELESFYSYETTVRERTSLLKKIVSVPSSLSAAQFATQVACYGFWLFLYVRIAHLNLNSIILIGTIIYMGIYCDSVYVITESIHKICSRHAQAIVQKGVSEEEVEKKHSFGLSSATITIILVFIPILLITVMFFLFAWRTYASYSSVDVVFTKLVIIGLVGIGIYSFFANCIFRRMMRSVNKMKDLLGGINKENLHKVKRENTDLTNEFMYNVHLINTIVEILQSILRKSQEISMEVIESSNELSVISRETAVTSLEQNSGVKELLSAMEETDELSKSIAEKIGEVSLVAKKTTDNIMDGFDILKQNMNKLDEIKAANDITVEGIKKLTEKITGISDIARIINGIADQTNIIAFNAEIEASSAGDVGDNFALVANEIRRLTNNTIQSTNEIRKRIIEIQHSSEALLTSSQNGSNKILAGTKIINELNDRFEELQHSSETMDYASEDIKKIIEQQTASFAQIVVTLRQITASSESFSTSTQKISDSAQNLCVISEKLKKLQPEDGAEEAAEISASEVE